VTESQTKPNDSDESLLATSGSIAIATLTSRITGFIRTVLVTSMLGAAISSAFITAYTLPSMVAEALLGAVLTAIVIPVLVRAEREDEDGGAGFINRVFTLALTVLTVGTVVALIAAPVLTLVSLGDGKVNRSLATHLSFLLLPEILFYGLSALFIATLNMRGNFKPGAWAPVVNNLVQITTLIVYAIVPGEISLNPVRMGDTKLLVLGIGTTLGVVAQAFILVPALRRSGVHLKLKWGLDARLRKFGNMASAVILYVVVLQVGWVITTRIAAHADAAGPANYSQHWMLLQVPYGVLGVTILTAIMPRLSRNAAADDTASVVDDLSVATRLTMVALVPIITFMTFFGPAIGVALFNFGKFDEQTATQLGTVLTCGAFTIIPYSMTLVQLRVFYAREDAWTPTVMTVGITVVKVAFSYLGLLLFDNGEDVVRWLAFSNGLGYLVGAIVGHYLLRRRMGPIRMTNVTRTTAQTLAASVACSGVVWGLAEISGMHKLGTDAGKFGSLAYLTLVALVSLGLTYAALTLMRVPDVIAVGVTARRALGRFIPALAPPADQHPETRAEMTLRLPRISTDESVPYGGEVQIGQRFDPATSSWRTYSELSGGAVDRGQPDSGQHDLRYRRQFESAAGPAETIAPVPGTLSQDPRPARPRPRGPMLVPGAAVAGGRYRLLQPHGGADGLQFWRARDISLDRDVALTFVDANQLAPAPDSEGAEPPRGTGPQAVLSRTLRLGRLNTPGVARVLDVIRGSSGGIVVAEWVPGSSLTEVALSRPSALGAAHAVRTLAAGAEAAHRSGAALSIDHPDRIRISSDGEAVLAFPGTMADASRDNDVRGLGAVLYALLLAAWPMDPARGNALATTADTAEPVGGLPAATPNNRGLPIEPRAARAGVPFEISTVAVRALEGNSGIRTAATVQHLLDQATVLDQKTDLILPIDGKPAVLAGSAAAESPRRRSRTRAMLVGSALLALFLVIALVVWLAGAFDTKHSTSSSTSAPTTSSSAAPSSTATAAPVLKSVEVMDYSSQEPDSSEHVRNTITGQAPPWSTDSYLRYPRFGNLKPGVGLLYTLAAPASFTSVTIRTTTPGVVVQIRTLDSPDATFASSTVVGRGSLTQRTTSIPVTLTAPTRYVMVWLTELPENSQGRYQGTIAQVSLEP
jgi:putative peptidoglycan lipid II flippase